jgi:hypothetical protein
MRTLYRRVDTRETAAAEQILSVIERDKPDLVILETENIQTLRDVVECGDIWSALEDWNITFAAELRGERVACVYAGTPWDMDESLEARQLTLSTAQIGSIRIAGPRPGKVHLAWASGHAGVEIDIES